MKKSNISLSKNSWTASSFFFLIYHTMTIKTLIIKMYCDYRVKCNNKGQIYHIVINPDRLDQIFPNLHNIITINKNNKRDKKYYYSKDFF